MPPGGKVPEVFTHSPEGVGEKEVQTGIEALDVAEQEILASIQELQRQLWEHKNKEDQRDENGTKQGARSELDHEESGAEQSREKSRVVVVSNRLPISAQRNLETGKWTFKMSSGGLVTALQGVRHE
ncbi:unnamed protein product, partial [Ectocarpus fasciculatus]